MDLNLLQREVAVTLGVNEATIHNWETGQYSISLSAWPAFLEFLGYDPRPPGRTVGEKLRFHREAGGLSAAEVARQWGVDPATVTKYELKADRLHNHFSIPKIAGFLGYNPLPQPESPGRYVRQVRYLAGLKQTEFAARLRVSNNTVSQWELDQRLPSMEQLESIEANSLKLPEPLPLACPEPIKAQCATAPRPDRRTKPRSAYPDELNILGDHVRKRRLDLGISQAALGRLLGVDRNAVCNWERALQDPDLSVMPKIIEFLGYEPSTDGLALAVRLRMKRRALGMNQSEFAEHIGAATKSLHYWETGTRIPRGLHLKRIQKLLEA
jgi:transcriptional regulator with XRE-family HTH domain